MCPIVLKTALLQSEVEMRKIDLQETNEINGTSFCVTKCEFKDGTISCLESTEECIDSNLYCDGIIDLKNTIGNETSQMFVKNGLLPNNETQNVTQTVHALDDTLLFPDEIYCSERVHTVFMFCYVITFLSFCAAIAVVVRTRPLVHYLIRRRAKELAKKRAKEENIPYGRVSESH